MKKKISLIILAIFILLAGSTTVFACNNVVNYISIDINPSVEIGVNMFDKVVSVEGTNEDGQNLIQDLDLENMSVDDAVTIIMEQVADEGYIAEDGSTVISVITEKEDEELQNKATKGVSLAMSNKNLIAPMYVNASSPELRAEAKEMGISPGKYKLIKMLQTLDPTITVEQYKDEKVSEIVRKANELLIANGFEGKQTVDIQTIVDNLEQLNDEIDEDENEEDDNGAGKQNKNKVNTNSNKNHTKVKNNKKSMIFFNNLYV